MVFAAVAGVAAAGAALAVRTTRHRSAAGQTPPQAVAPSELAAPAPAKATTTPPQRPAVPPSPTARPRRSRPAALIAVAVVAAAGGMLVGRATESGTGAAAAPHASASASTFPALADPAGWMTTSPNWAPLPRPSSPAPVPAGGTVPRNGSVIMDGDNGEQVTISVVRVEDPELSVFPELKPATGDRLVSVTVNANNTGAIPFIAQLQKYAWVADDEGEWYQRDTTMTTALAAFPDALVEPKSEFARTIVFEMPQDARLTRLRLSLQPGVAARTAVWKLI
jgi:hypothetical protein